jgi:hypothetical protein
MTKKNRMTTLAAPTMTGAMNDVLEQREGSIEEYRKGIFQGIELFDREATFGKALHYGADLIHFSAFGK